MRLSMTLLAMLSLSGTSVLAQPAKHPLPRASEGASKPPVVVLASADADHAVAPAPAQPSTEPKRPAPRITHCRCGDPAPGEATPEQ